MTDLSEKPLSRLDSQVLEFLLHLDSVITQLGIDFFLVGAQARDIYLLQLRGEASTRKTLDYDFGIRVASWDQFFETKSALIATGRYAEIKGSPQRLKYKQSILLDLLPFGQIESPTGIITWPGDYPQSMSTMGFQEAYESSIPVVIQDNPIFTVRVCSVPGLIALKLIAWEERAEGSAKDAQDIVSLIKAYLFGENSERLYLDEQDILNDPDFDFDRAGARLLGRDISRVVSEPIKQHLVRLLLRETQVSFSLVRDMLIGFDSEGIKAQYHLSLLRSLLQGIGDK